MDNSYKKNHFLNYLIVYFLIAFSGIPFFDLNKVAKLFFLIFLLLVYSFSRKRFDSKLTLIVLFAIVIIIIQSIFWGGNIYTVFTYLGLMIITPYVAIKIVGPKFIYYFKNIIFFYAVIGIFFWFLSNISSSFYHFTFNLSEMILQYSPLNISESFILYTYETSQIFGLIRNPGPFHEPGAWAVFLTMGIVVEIIIKNRFITPANIFFVTNIITTFSTAGYIALFTIIIFYIVTSNLQAPIKAILIITLFFLGLYTYNTLDFLGTKIDTQFEQQTNAELTKGTSGRFLGARKALVVLARYPLWGRGLLEVSKASAFSDEGAGYGWITFISKIGLPVGVLFLLYFFRSIKNYCVVNYQSKLFPYFALFSLLIVLAGQKHINSVMFFAFVFSSVFFPIRKYFNQYKLKVPKINV